MEVRDRVYVSAALPSEDDPPLLIEQESDCTQDPVWTR
jgi:hypothetical protein